MGGKNGTKFNFYSEKKQQRQGRPGGWQTIKLRDDFPFLPGTDTAFIILLCYISFSIFPIEATISTRKHTFYKSRRDEVNSCHCSKLVSHCKTSIGENLVPTHVNGLCEIATPLHNFIVTCSATPCFGQEGYCPKGGATNEKLYGCVLFVV